MLRSLPQVIDTVKSYTTTMSVWKSSRLYVYEFFRTNICISKVAIHFASTNKSSKGKGLRCSVHASTSTEISRSILVSALALLPSPQLGISSDFYSDPSDRLSNVPIQIWTLSI